MTDDILDEIVGVLPEPAAPTPTQPGSAHSAPRPPSAAVFAAEIAALKTRGQSFISVIHLVLLSFSNANGHAQVAGSNGSAAVTAPVLRFREFHELAVQFRHFSALFR